MVSEVKEECIMFEGALPGPVNYRGGLFCGGAISLDVAWLGYHGFGDFRLLGI